MKTVRQYSLSLAPPDEAVVTDLTERLVGASAHAITLAAVRIGLEALTQDPLAILPRIQDQRYASKVRLRRAEGLELSPEFQARLEARATVGPKPTVQRVVVHETPSIHDRATVARSKTPTGIGFPPAPRHGGAPQPQTMIEMVGSMHADLSKPFEDDDMPVKSAGPHPSADDILREIGVPIPEPEDDPAPEDARLALEEGLDSELQEVLDNV